LPAPLLARTRARSNRPDENPQLRLAFTIAEFCGAHGFSRGHFYTLKKLGLAPRTMGLAGRVVISAEAAADWRKEREAVA
jgi:hypothetical protein